MTPAMNVRLTVSSMNVSAAQCEFRLWAPHNTRNNIINYYISMHVRKCCVHRQWPLTVFTRVSETCRVAIRRGCVVLLLHYMV